LVHAEFLWIQHRLQYLLLQRFRASVPEERPPITAIDNRWSIARTFLTIDPACDFAPVGEGEFGIVTGCARERSSRERCLSKNSFRPRAILAGVSGDIVLKIIFRPSEWTCG